MFYLNKIKALEKRIETLETDLVRKTCDHKELVFKSKLHFGELWYIQKCDTCGILIKAMTPDQFKSFKKQQLIDKIDELKTELKSYDVPWHDLPWHNYEDGENGKTT